MNKSIKIVICTILSIIIIIFSIIGVKSVFTSPKVSEIEKIKFFELSDKIMSYMEYVDTNQSNDIDRYINYAIFYNLNENDSDTTSIDDVKNIVESVFNIELNIEDIEEKGITPSMVDNNINYDYNNKEFTIDNKLTMRDIAAKEIVYYDVDNIILKKDKYVVIYNKYLINNPYDILNYYANNNKDTKEISQYLEGKANEKTFRKYINSDVLENLDINSTQIKISYIVNDNKILVDSIY